MDAERRQRLTETTRYTPSEVEEPILARWLEGGYFHPQAEGSATERRYNLTFSINFQNLLNHTNAGIPIGNLSSPLFGLSNASASGFGFAAVSQSAGNRRIEAQLRLSF